MKCRFLRTPPGPRHHCHFAWLVAGATNFFRIQKIQFLLCSIKYEISRSISYVLYVCVETVGKFKFWNMYTDVVISCYVFTQSTFCTIWKQTIFTLVAMLTIFEIKLVKHLFKQYGCFQIFQNIILWEMSCFKQLLDKIWQYLYIITKYYYTSLTNTSIDSHQNNWSRSWNFFADSEKYT